MHNHLNTAKLFSNAARSLHNFTHRINTNKKHLWALVYVSNSIFIFFHIVFVGKCSLENSFVWHSMKETMARHLATAAERWTVFLVHRARCTRTNINGRKCIAYCTYRERVNDIIILNVISSGSVCWLPSFMSIYTAHTCRVKLMNFILSTAFESSNNNQMNWKIESSAASAVAILLQNNPIHATMSF